MIAEQVADEFLELQENLEELAEIYMDEINQTIQEVYPGFPTVIVTPRIFVEEKAYTFDLELESDEGVDPALAEDTLAQAKEWLETNMLESIEGDAE